MLKVWYGECLEFQFLDWFRCHRMTNGQKPGSLLVEKKSAWKYLWFCLWWMKIFKITFKYKFKSKFNRKVQLYHKISI